MRGALLNTKLLKRRLQSGPYTHRTVAGVICRTSKNTYLELLPSAKIRRFCQHYSFLNTG